MQIVGPRCAINDMAVPDIVFDRDIRGCWIADTIYRNRYSTLDIPGSQRVAMQKVSLTFFLGLYTVNINLNTPAPHGWRSSEIICAGWRTLTPREGNDLITQCDSVYHAIW